MTKRLALSIILLFGSFFTAAASCSAATMSIGTLAPQVVGDTFSVPVYASAEGDEALNAISTTITFPPQQLRVVLVDGSGVVDFWAQKPEYSNANGTISFQGVTYNPGFSGKLGKVVTITFRVLKSGTAQLAFSAPSIFANDGQGTEILTSAKGTTLALREAPAVVKPSVVVSESATTTSAPSLVDGSLASSTDAKALFDVSIQPAVATVTPPAPVVAISNDFLSTLELVLIILGIVAASYFFIWYVWYRMHHVRRRLLRHIASTDTTLHAELFEVHEALKEEVVRLRHAQIDRELTKEEKHMLVRFAHLIEKVEQAL